ncbi:hypothetical protein KW795_02855 [Candidatus Microgenomates bacterium]|nr:hypothetical protein [Candidatus Microgenomates bacterium]
MTNTIDTEVSSQLEAFSMDASGMLIKKPFGKLLKENRGKETHLHIGIGNTIPESYIESNSFVICCDPQTSPFKTNARNIDIEPGGTLALVKESASYIPEFKVQVMSFIAPDPREIGELSHQILRFLPNLAIIIFDTTSNLAHLADEARSEVLGDLDIRKKYITHSYHPDEDDESNGLTISYETLIDYLDEANIDIESDIISEERIDTIKGIVLVKRKIR